MADITKITIPDGTTYNIKDASVPSKLSGFTDDLGSSPTHTHGQYVTTSVLESQESVWLASATAAAQALDENLSTEIAKKGTYSKPAGGIPKTDLASSVQTSLGKADTALQSHQDISGKLNASLKGVANGLAELDSNGKVPASQLPSYVDDVLEYSAKSSFPADGETGKIYVNTSDNKTYRWGGSSYVEISPSIALGETSSTAYRGDRGKTAYDHSQSTHARTDATKVESSTTNGSIKINGTEAVVYTHPTGTNPHGTTKSDVGLGNVGNFKAVSTSASQGLTDAEKSNARANIGAGTSSFSGSYNDLSNKPTIPSSVTESTVSGWGFTKNTGTYSKPSSGIPKTDLASAVQTSLGKADTALQRYTETDPTVPSWAKASSKPSYTASEVGAIPSSSTYVNLHPENSPVLLPFMNNDISFLTRRGGECKVYYDGVEQSIDINSVFDASPSYWAINPSGITTIIFELTLHKVFGWSSNIYFDNGSSVWRAKNVKIEVMNTNYSSDVWTVKYNVTGLVAGNGYVLCSHTPVGASNAGGGFNKIRFTFSNWTTSTNFRISQLGVYNYGSLGMRETYVSRGMDDSLYRNFSPSANNTYTIGSSSYKWKDVYTTSLNGTSIPSSPKFTDTVYTHPTTAGNKHIPTGGSSGQVLAWSSSGTAVWKSINELISDGDGVSY